MNDIIQMRTAEQFFEEFGREKLYKQKMDKSLVKKEMVDALHKEIYQVVADRAKRRFGDIPPEGDPEALRIAANVVKDEWKKWKKIVSLFERYRETSGVVTLDDISMVPEEGNGEIGFKNGELVIRAEEEAEEEMVPAEEDIEEIEEDAGENMGTDAQGT